MDITVTLTEAELAVVIDALIGRGIRLLQISEDVGPERREELFQMIREGEVVMGKMSDAAYPAALVDGSAADAAYAVLAAAANVAYANAAKERARKAK